MRSIFQNAFRRVAAEPKARGVIFWKGEKRNEKGMVSMERP